MRSAFDAVVRLAGQVHHGGRVVGALGPCASRAATIAASVAMLPPDAMLPPAEGG
jgi:hypothetical protein